MNSRFQVRLGVGKRLESKIINNNYFHVYYISQLSTLEIKRIKCILTDYTVIGNLILQFLKRNIYIT